MREQEHNPSEPKPGADFDRLLDVALAKYSAAEPRVGLEERILANLRTQPAQTTARSWWQWSLAAAAVAIIAIAGSLAWRANRTPRPNIAEHSRTTIEPLVEPEKQIAHDDGPPARSRKHVVKHERMPRPEQVAVTRFDQFPSPQPLNDQEKLLLDYVARYPKEAVLVARAREEQLERDRAEEEASRANHP